MYFLYEFYIVCMFECICVLVEGKVEGKVQGKDESLVSVVRGFVASKGYVSLWRFVWRAEV